MKKKAIVVSVLLSAFVLLGTMAYAKPGKHGKSPFKALMDLLTALEDRIAAIEGSGGSGNGLQRIVIEGDLEQYPLVWEYDNGNGLGWMIIDEPSIDIEDMPSITMYAERSPGDWYTWFEGIQTVSFHDGQIRIPCGYEHQHAQPDPNCSEDPDPDPDPVNIFIDCSCVVSESTDGEDGCQYKLVRVDPDQCGNEYECFSLFDCVMECSSDVFTDECPDPGAEPAEECPPIYETIRDIDPTCENIKIVIIK